MIGRPTVVLIVGHLITEHKIKKYVKQWAQFVAKVSQDTFDAVKTKIEMSCLQMPNC